MGMVFRTFLIALVFAIIIFALGANNLFTIKDDFADFSLDTNEIRSSVGLGLDWLSPIGPMNFSVAQPITKAKSDKVETFRFNLGTSF